MPIDPLTKNLAIWVIYKNPSDFPGQVIARKWIAQSPEPYPTRSIIRGLSVERLRDQFILSGLKCFPRDPKDDACVVESWL